MHEVESEKCLSSDLKHFSTITHICYCHNFQIYISCYYKHFFNIKPINQEETRVKYNTISSVNELFGEKKSLDKVSSVSFCYLFNRASSARRLRMSITYARSNNVLLLHRKI